MAEDENESAETSEGEDDGAPKKKKLSGKLIVLIAAPVLLLVIGGVVLLLMMGGGDKSDVAVGGDGAHGEGGHGEAVPHEVVFYELPSMLVNLNASAGGARYLKLQVSIELSSHEDIAQIEPLMPRIIDQFQIYLRELRVSELSGSAGMFHLKQELLRRINLSVPVPVKDVLFTEMIIQ